MTRKYILKPGRHQFVPGAHAIHNNENLSDDDAEWYLEKYPHIASMFEVTPTDQDTIVGEPNTACRVSGEDQTQSSNKIEDAKTDEIE